jgi:hypothetical protein
MFAFIIGAEELLDLLLYCRVRPLLKSATALFSNWEILFRVEIISYDIVF